MPETLAFETPHPLKREKDTLVDPVAPSGTLSDDGPTVAVRMPPPDSFGADATMAAEDLRFSLPRVSDAGPRGTVLPLWQGGAAVFRAGQLRYERLRALGEGGMGEVALARDHDIDRRVAIKRLRPEHANASALLRFAQEVRTIGSLEHPNIVPVHDVGVDEEGKHYFVMKYVEGDTLETIIERLQARDPATERRFPLEVRAQVFLGVLRAVQYAHARGIMHRDIKPANIMIGPYGEVMVMDWGLARPVRNAELAALPDDHSRPVDGAASSLETQHGAVMGTPHYMSPEQARGETDQINERSDVYSLSVMFHELMSLRHYLDGKNGVHAVLAAVATVKDRSVVEWVADAAATGAPMEYLHFIRKGVSARASDRYADAGQMAGELEDILSGRIKVQCHISGTKRLGHMLMHAIDRHPLVASVFVLLGALSAVAAVLGAFFGLLRLVGVA
ncbi:MAG: Serine/threonine protein kinase PrkC, regulator of stationary phase [Myxococcaceae bacterium]|nr:Serine/threonine protein kinase PrkC, regulator of stationary phase [Myxococcaceae bacterium]